jgi:hypothetical protein
MNRSFIINPMNICVTHSCRDTLREPFFGEFNAYLSGGLE